VFYNFIDIVKQTSVLNHNYHQP